MKIVFDCFKLVKGKGKSIGIYNLTKNLIINLAKEKRNTDSKDIKCAELIVIGNRYNKDEFNVQGVSFIEEKKLNPLKKLDCILWELLVVSKRAKLLQADKMVFPRGFAALTHPVDDIIIIHDLIPFYYAKFHPNYFKKIENLYIMSRLRMSALNCNKIFTISEASKKDILRYVHVDEEKIVVIHNGCNELGNIKKRKMVDRYIIAVTSELPHKNAKGIVQSYKFYYEYTKNPLNLVIIGLDNVDAYELPINVKNKISCYKYIKDNEKLYQLIANASIFLFLSYIEGFGFPPIEAMQLGTPVICSNQSSLPEIVGDAAIQVDPNDYKKIGMRIDDLVKNEILQQKLIIRGNDNIKRFSWESRAKIYWREILK